MGKFLVVESDSEKAGINPDCVQVWKLDKSKKKLVLLMVSGETIELHVSRVKNLILYLEDNSFLIDTDNTSIEKEATDN